MKLFHPIALHSKTKKMFRRCKLKHSAKDIALRGSEWTRLLLRTSLTGNGATVPCDTGIVLFPMLHVASVKFYDSVLEGVKSLAEDDAGSTLPLYALLEGVLSSDNQRALDAKEYNMIYYDANIKSQVTAACCGSSQWDPLANRSRVGLGMQNTNLYSDDVLREICGKELNLGFETIVDYNKQKISLLDSSTNEANLLHLQDAYFKPLLATIAGNSMLSADVTEADLMKGLGTDTGVPLHKLPQQRVKAFREEHLANFLLHIVKRQAMLKQAEWAQKELTDTAVPLCNIAVLWGHYHTDGILEALKAQINDINASGTAMMTIERGPTVFRTLPYGVPESFLANK